MYGGARRTIIGLALVALVFGAANVSAGADGDLIERFDVPYTHEAALDAFLPVEPEGLVPVVLIVHGGGWRTGDKQAWAGRARDLVRRTGWAALTVNYDLHADEPYVTQPANVRAAVAWARENADHLGFDPSRIGLLGSSAGGHLAMLVATTSNGDERVSAVVSWSGIADLPRLARAPRDDQVVKDLAARYIGGPLEELPDRWIDGSPVAHVDPDDPPMFLAGSLDETMVPIDQLEAMRDVLLASGVEVVTTILPGTRHASAFADDVWEQTIEFLVGHL